MTSDQTYIEEILSGNTNTFEVLVNRYKDLVYTLAYRMVKNREEAEEIAQDTFIKVYKSLPKFKGESKFSTWVYKIAYNTSLDSIKKLKLKHRETDIDALSYEKVIQTDNALERLERNERNKIIKQCIEQLSATDSFLLTLFYYKELSLEEISEIADMKVNNVKVKIHRARKRLAELLRAQLDKETIESYDIKIRTAHG